MVNLAGGAGSSNKALTRTCFDINPNAGTRVSDVRRRVVAETTVHTGAKTPPALAVDVLRVLLGRT